MLNFMIIVSIEYIEKDWYKKQKKMYLYTPKPSFTLHHCLNFTTLKIKNKNKKERKEEKKL